MRPAAARSRIKLEHVLLAQRIEAARRLVEDQQLWVVHEGRDDADLLLVALREVADPPLEIELQALGELARSRAARRRRAGDRGTRGSPIAVLLGGSFSSPGR